MAAFGPLLTMCIGPEPEKAPPPLPITNQSRPHSDQTCCRASGMVDPGQFLQFYDKNVTTAVDLIYKGMKNSSPNADCLGKLNPFTNGYQWITYKQAIQQMRLFGGGLVQLGFDPSPRTIIGIYCINCIEWVIAEYGCYHFSMAIAPLYDTLGANACVYIINHAEIQLILTDTTEKIERLLREAPRTPTVRFIVTTQGRIEPHLLDKADEVNIRLMTFAEVQEQGRHIIEIVPPSPRHLALICYTSGTTGVPKGVMLTHANLMGTNSGIITIFRQIAAKYVDKQMTSISYLPLAHIFERVVQQTIFFYGGRIGFFSGDIKRLPSDLKALKPSVLPSVPRLINRIYQRVASQVGRSKFKSKMVEIGLRQKQKDIEKFIIRNNGPWDRIAFRKIREAVGGNVLVMISGSAPISPTILTFMRCALGCFVLEGYGQTESAGVISLTLPGDYTSGHVGPPLPCCVVKLADVPEMDYYAGQSGIGEICVKGTNVFIGYYKNEEATREAIDPEGWLHTGDIGQWTPEGTLKIIDRKKHIFKLSQGEYIAPEKIENVYCQSSYVGQCYVEGDSTQSFVVAVVVPDVEALNNWCVQRNLLFSMDQACRQKLFKDAVLNDMWGVGQREGLNSLEQVKDAYLHPEPFSMENELLTPTMKLKRANCRRYFRSQIAALYEKNDPERNPASASKRAPAPGTETEPTSETTPNNQTIKGE